MMNTTADITNKLGEVLVELDAIKELVGPAQEGHISQDAFTVSVECIVSHASQILGACMERLSVGVAND